MGMGRPRVLEDAPALTRLLYEVAQNGLRRAGNQVVTPEEQRVLMSIMAHGFRVLMGEASRPVENYIALQIGWLASISERYSRAYQMLPDELQRYYHEMKQANAHLLPRSTGNSRTEQPTLGPEDEPPLLHLDEDPDEPGS